MRSSRDWLLLYNSRSRRGRRLRGRIQQLIARSGKDTLAGIPWIPLEELGCRQTIPERLLALGGDGTINAAVTWLLERGGDAPLGILPAGTGNNLARHLGIPLDLEEAFRLATSEARVRRIDVVAIQEAPDGPRHFMIQSAALGFPAVITQRYENLRRRPLLRRVFAPLGPYIYRVLAILGLSRQRRLERRGENLLEVRWQHAGETIRENALVVFLGNDPTLGGNFLPCPRARSDDGLVDFCILRAGTAHSYLKLFRKVVRGEHLVHDDAFVYRQAAGPVEIGLSHPSPLLVDGDIKTSSDRVVVEVLPGRAGVLVGEK